jgi:hypothetical protein
MVIANFIGTGYIHVLPVNGLCSKRCAISPMSCQEAAILPSVNLWHNHKSQQ